MRLNRHNSRAKAINSMIEDTHYTAKHRKTIVKHQQRRKGPAESSFSRASGMLVHPPAPTAARDAAQHPPPPPPLPHPVHPPPRQQHPRPRTPQPQQPLTARPSLAYLGYLCTPLAVWNAGTKNGTKGMALMIVRAACKTKKRNISKHKIHSITKEIQKATSQHLNILRKVM